MATTATISIVPKTTETLETTARKKMPPKEVRGASAERAYYRAEKRGFAMGREEEDWLEAEQEVKKLSEILPRPFLSGHGKPAMTRSGIRADTRIAPEREKELRQYESMTCIVCGEPMKKYLAHYPRQAHVRCLLRESRKSERATFRFLEAC